MVLSSLMLLYDSLMVVGGNPLHHLWHVWCTLQHAYGTCLKMS